jgi:type I site-specific restriction-modification system R (restriction) subunit
MTTIQKFCSKENHIHTDEKVIALVDEGHRSQYKFNAEAMRAAMPDARISACIKYYHNKHQFLNTLFHLWLQN